MKNRFQAHRPKRQKKVQTVKVVPVPFYITCPRCGEEVELWSEENETLCYLCGYRLFKKEIILH